MPYQVFQLYAHLHGNKCLTTIMILNIFYFSLLLFFFQKKKSKLSISHKKFTKYMQMHSICLCLTQEHLKQILTADPVTAKISQKLQKINYLCHKLAHKKHSVFSQSHSLTEASLKKKTTHCGDRDKGPQASGI